jgi:hypothetical protein
MPETWVHANVFVPRQYGPAFFFELDGISWSDQQGIKDGHVARFGMKDETDNWFHSMIPVVGQQQLREVRAEFSSTFPRLVSAHVHAGGTSVTFTDAPQVTSTGTFSVFSLPNINQQVSRGLCISLGFTTKGVGLGPGTISFFGAGAIFA